MFSLVSLENNVCLEWAVSWLYHQYIQKSKYSSNAVLPLQCIPQRLLQIHRITSNFSSLFPPSTRLPRSHKPKVTFNVFYSSLDDKSFVFLISNVNFSPSVSYYESTSV